MVRQDMNDEKIRQKKWMSGKKVRVVSVILALILVAEMTLLGGLLYIRLRPEETDAVCAAYVNAEPDRIIESLAQTGTEAQEALKLKEEEQRIKEEEMKKKDKLIVIDAGHQAKQNSEKEPVGPGASQMKAKVSSGTAGRYTGVPEYQVTLDVSLKLQKELQDRGYEVLMVRTSNDVNISNSERARLANDNQADAFVRIHCDGSENASANGAMTICMTPNNPYCANLYENSQKLSTKILDCLCRETGAARNKVWETDTMSGINWCQVPVTIVEMGYMTNEAEDRKLVTAEYQQQLAVGIANGIEAYFE